LKVKCKDIVDYFEKFAPSEFAESYDNVGLLLGSYETEVERVMVSLDVTSEAADEADRMKADMIISHHPIIFNALHNIREDNEKNKLICKLIRNNIIVFSAHTNLDVAYGGVNDCLLEVLGLEAAHDITRNAQISEKHNEIGRYGILKIGLTIEEFISHVKQNLNVEKVRFTGKNNSIVRKIAVFSGSFDGNWSWIIEAGAKILVTGEIKYHQILEAKEIGIGVIDAGHYATEAIIKEVLVKKIKEQFPELTVMKSIEEHDPVQYI
jgi:GTP cyclohydrolase I